jgi:hypothetical protein
MHSHQLKREMIQNSVKVIRIVSFQVIDQPGKACIEVLKDRYTGKTGIQIVNITDLKDCVIYA